MSETTLDQIRHFIRLCDAAERAETLEDENAELDRKWRAMNGYYEQAVEKLKVALAERDALAAQLTELRQLRERAESDADEAIRGQLAAVKRAEAAEAQLTEVTRELTAEREAHEVCSRGQQLIIDTLNRYEAALSSLRAVVEERMMKLSNWIRTPFNINPDDAIDECARLIANNAKTIALPADPSAPTLKE